MLDAWEGSWDRLGKEAGTVERAIGGGWWWHCAACKSVSLSQTQLSTLFFICAVVCETELVVPAGSPAYCLCTGDFCGGPPLC